VKNPQPRLNAEFRVRRHPIHPGPAPSADPRPSPAVCRGLGWSMIGRTASRRLSSAVETPDGLTPSAQRPVAIPLKTGNGQRNTQPSSVIGRQNARRAAAVGATCCAGASLESHSASQKVVTLGQAHGRQVPRLHKPPAVLRDYRTPAVPFVPAPTIHVLPVVSYRLYSLYRRSRQASPNDENTTRCLLPSSPSIPMTAR
jgi:hypothetical protein